MTNEIVKDCVDEVFEDETTKPSCCVKAVSVPVE